MRWLLFVALAGCAAAPVEVLRVEDLGPLAQSAQIRARDGGYSGVVGGRSVWVYGDSVLTAPGEDGSTWRHNTWSWTDNFEPGAAPAGFVEDVDPLGAPRPLFTPTPTEQAFNDAHSGDDCEAPCGARWALWPGPVVDDPARQRAVVFFVQIYGEPGPFNFHGVGAGAAAWADVTRPVVRAPLRPEAEHPTTLFDEGEPAFASAAVVVGEDVYVYACGGLDKACELARVPLARVLERSAWRYWDGAAWGDDLAAAATVMHTMDMTSVHYDDALGFVAVWSEPLSTAVKLRTAPAPEGPWSRAVTLFEAERAPNGDAPYSGLAHAELSGDGVLVVTYYRGLGDWDGELRAVAVTLAAR